MRVLLQAGADPASGCPLLDALACRNAVAVRALLRAMSPASTARCFLSWDDNGGGPLHAAARSPASGLARHVLRIAAGLHRGGDAAAMRAARMRVAAARRLMDVAEDLAVEPPGAHAGRHVITKRALDAAAGDASLRDLLAAAAAINLAPASEFLERRDGAGDTPMALACRGGRSGAVRELLRAGASPLRVAAGGLSCAHLAVGAGHVVVLEALLDAGVLAGVGAGSEVLLDAGALAGVGAGLDAGAEEAALAAPFASAPSEAAAGACARGGAGGGGGLLCEAPVAPAAEGGPEQRAVAVGVQGEASAGGRRASPAAARCHPALSAPDDYARTPLGAARGLGPLGEAAAAWLSAPGRACAEAPAARAPPAEAPQRASACALSSLRLSHFQGAAHAAAGWRLASEAQMRHVRLPRALRRRIAEAATAGAEAGAQAGAEAAAGAEAGAQSNAQSAGAGAGAGARAPAFAEASFVPEAEAPCSGPAALLVEEVPFEWLREASQWAAVEKAPFGGLREASQWAGAAPGHPGSDAPALPGAARLHRDFLSLGRPFVVRRWVQQTQAGAGAGGEGGGERGAEAGAPPSGGAGASDGEGTVAGVSGAGVSDGEHTAAGASGAPLSGSRPKNISAHRLPREGGAPPSEGAPLGAYLPRDRLLRMWGALRVLPGDIPYAETYAYGGEGAGRGGPTPRPAPTPLSAFMALHMRGGSARGRLALRPPYVFDGGLLHTRAGDFEAVLGAAAGGGAAGGAASGAGAGSAPSGAGAGRAASGAEALAEAGARARGSRGALRPLLPGPPLTPRAGPALRQLILGPPLSGAPPHFHPPAANLLLTGLKLWLLAPPQAAAFAPAHAAEAFRAALRGASASASANASAAPPPLLLLLQEPGDLVWVPPEWGHACLNLGDALAFAFE